MSPSPIGPDGAISSIIAAVAGHCSEDTGPARTLGSNDEPTPSERRAAMTWAQRLKRVFGIDIETCRARGGAVRIIGSIEDPAVIEKILTHLDAQAGEPETPRRPPSRAPPQILLFD